MFGFRKSLGKAAARGIDPNLMQIIAEREVSDTPPPLVRFVESIDEMSREIAEQTKVIRQLADQVERAVERGTRRGIERRSR